ncbi:hypothetical protein [uncultured Microbulbifer sp.]|uniref:hypothetical protein n=1 Tax=uncultured Microbulbifer sp. TaxID=348147 RepID=UPI0026051406|nr:hypothetical protein [uncultured Microbulbifer sp.]
MDIPSVDFKKVIEELQGHESMHYEGSSDGPERSVSTSLKDTLELASRQCAVFSSDMAPGSETKKFSDFLAYLATSIY